MMTSDVTTTNTHTNTTTENNIPRRRRRRNRRILFRKNTTRNDSFLQRLLLLLLFVSLVFVSVSLNDDDDDFGGSKSSSSSSVGIFVRANRVGPRQTPSSRAALKRMSSGSSPQKREKQREIQQKEEKQRAKMKLLAKELEEKKRRKEEDKESAAPSSGTQKRKEEEEVKEEEEMTTTNTRERKEREQTFVEEEKEEEFTSAMMERDSSRRAGSNDDTKADPDDDEDEAGKVKEALPGSLPSSAEETEDDTTTAETPDTKEDEMKEEMMEQEVAEAQESDALSMGDLGTDSSGGETDDDVSKEEEEEEELTETPNGGERPTTSPEEEQGINDSIITSGEEGDNLDESAVAVEEKSTVDPVAEPELGDAKKEEEEEITSAEEGERIGEKADEKADEQLSKYETLMKEEEEVAKMAEEEEKRSVQAQQQTEEGSVAAEEEKEAPGEIEELPAVNEEKKEEDASPQEPDKVVLDGKSDTHDPLFKGDGKEEERYKEDAPMQEADALSMDFTDDDATATDKVEEEQKKEEEEEKVTVEEAPARVPTDEVIPIEGEEEKVEQEEAPTKKEQEQEKDWDKSQGVYEAILEADKNEETVANAIASAAKGGDRNNTDGNNTTSLTTTTTTTTKVLGGIPKSLGVVSASPLTNPTLSFAAFRFSKRLGYAFARPGKCICAGSCECAGACGSSMDSLKKQSTALKEAGVDAGVSVISDASLVYNKDLNLERWIGEVADPAVYGLERLYAAVEYYVSTDVDVEDATIYSIMNKSPYPELAKCDVFDAMFSQLREDRKNGKAVKVNVDAKDEAKLAVLTACDGFVNNPQATKFGGGTSAKEIAERFDAIIPADSGLDGLISLTFMSGFAISDLAYGANDEGSKQNKMRKEMGISVDLATEPDAVLKRLRDTNKVDEELYKQSTTWLDGVKEAHRKAFNAHKAIVEVWIEESDQYCESSTGSSRTCTQDGSSSSTTTDQFAELLGSFPEACKASDPKTRSCVDDWWECEGPGSEGSAFAGQFSKASAAATTTLDATGGEGGSPSSGQGRASAVEALSNFKYKVMYDREHPLNKAAQFGAHHSKKFARGTMNAVNVGAGHAVANFKKIPTGVHAGVAIIFIFSLFGYYTYVQYKSLQPVSSLELNTSSVKVLKSFENKEKALRGISNVPAGELMRDDAFWGGGLSQSEMERGTAGRGSSRVIGGTRRSNRNSAKNRGPMTEEELNFYEDLSD
jgi:hypothetical protein